jgi:hypothetical protein
MVFLSGMGYFLAAVREEPRPLPDGRLLAVGADCVARIGVGVVLGVLKALEVAVN